eukprot:11776163-Ditylum_brightwellii.AAC.1
MKYRFKTYKAKDITFPIVKFDLRNCDGDEFPIHLLHNDDESIVKGELPELLPCDNKESDEEPNEEPN